MRRQRPCQADLVYVFARLVRPRATEPFFFEQAASLGGGSRWLEAGQQLPRFHRKALIFDVSSQVAIEIPSTSWLPVQCYLYPTKTTLWHPGLSQLASKNAKKIEIVFDKFKNLYWLRPTS